MSVSEAEVDELFSTPPTQFIADRNELAKRARAGKQEALAKEIVSLRKPTATVWLLNQLARHHEQETAALLEASEKLRRAQTAALRGVGPAPLREANNAWRAAVSSALKRAREILKTAGGRQDLEEPRLVRPPLGVGEADLARAADHMGVGQRESVGRDHQARPDAGGETWPGPATHFTMPGTF
jgi:hypothetical protein